MANLQHHSWAEWTRAFWHGRLPAIYLMLYQVAYTLFLISYVRATVYFFPAIVAVIATYGVFTDMVAHLYPLNQTMEITFRQWVHKLMHGRTHDVYGMLIAIATTSYLMTHYLHWVGISILIFDFLCLLQIGGFAVTRFYH